MEKQKLIMEIDKFINTDVYGDVKFEFDKDITIVVDEYKTYASDGYSTTFQSIKVGKYSIKCNHFDGAELVEKAELLQNKLKTQSIEDTIKELTIGQLMETDTIREWK